MPNRPRIPKDIERQIFFETGHRCAVCGEPTPLERAHIIPWHKTKEHKAEDLMCMCANCHERSHKENWDEKTLRMYKEQPWITRKELPYYGNPLFVSRVEELAGLLAESLSGGWIRGISEEEAYASLRELHNLRGKLRKHSGLLQALRDFENSAGWILTIKGRFETSDERTSTLKELEERYQNVVHQIATIQNAG